MEAAASVAAYGLLRALFQIAARNIKPRTTIKLQPVRLTQKMKSGQREFMAACTSASAERRDAGRENR
jgi:hypothetical protein